MLVVPRGVPQGWRGSLWKCGFIRQRRRHAHCPIGLFFHDDPELYSHAETSAMLTNTRPIAVDGAATLARAIAKVFELRPSEPFDRQSFCRELIGFARAPEIVVKMQMVSTLLSKGVPAPEAADHLGRGVATQLSELMVPASLNCDLLFPPSRFPNEAPPGGPLPSRKAFPALARNH